jgi:hypothetical protein
LPKETEYTRQQTDVVFFDIAHGSALACAACLDVLTAKKQMKLKEADAGKLILIGIVSMLVGLILSTSPSRVYEESGEYIVNSSEDRDYDYDYDYDYV